MKHFLAIYSSEGNSETGQIHISALDLVDAQNKFFKFLQSLNLYQHMWCLNLKIIEITDSI